MMYLAVGPRLIASAGARVVVKVKEVNSAMSAMRQFFFLFTAMSYLLEGITPHIGTKALILRPSCPDLIAIGT
jgi:hypothetical protein